MKRIRVADLKPTERQPHSLYHESGLELLPAWGMLGKQHIDLMRSCGIDVVYEIEDPPDLEEFIRKVSYRTVQVSSLELGIRIPEPVYSSNHVLLLQANVPITPTIKTHLLERGYHSVFIKKTAVELKAGRAEKYLHERTGLDDVGGLLKAVDEMAGDQKNGMAKPLPTAQLPRGVDRRQFRRFQGGCPMTFVVQQRFSSMWNKATCVAHVKDISKGGVCISTAEEITKGQKFKFVLQPDPKRPRLAGIAEVVRVRKQDGGFEAGARFLFVGSEK